MPGAGCVCVREVGCAPADHELEGAVLVLVPIPALLLTTAQTQEAGFWRDGRLVALVGQVVAETGCGREEEADAMTRPLHNGRPRRRRTWSS